MRVPGLLTVLSSSIFLLRGVSARATGSAWTRSDGNEATGAPVASFAFCFDIDGVLFKGGNRINGAKETLDFLSDFNIPFVLLTNGGGKTEAARVADLNEKLQLKTPLKEEQFIQSHTPFSALVDGDQNLRKKTVLVTGLDYQVSRHIMHNYGFESVITPGDIWKADPSIFPFVKENEKKFYQNLPPLPKSLFKEKYYNELTNFSDILKVDAMFILNDVRDWALDYQIFSDIFLSHKGYYGTYSKKNDAGGWQQDGQPTLYFSNADLVWAGAYHLPRYGQGSTKATLDGLWREHTGGAQLASKVYGKPTELAYRFAEQRLRGVRDQLFQNKQIDKKAPRLERVYMIGDNPESDIAGPNTYKSENGTEWLGLLVEGGVWDKDRSKPFTDVTRPRIIKENVLKVVAWALEQEGWKIQGLNSLKSQD